MWQSHLAYHPRLGYTFTPHFKGRMPHESGGFLMRTNEAGFRSERPFTQQRRPGTARALVFGDSQTAGLGVSNRDRFTDVLETLRPDLEMFNYGLDGTGTDQQYLAYQEFGRVEHNLLIIAVYVEDAARVNARYAKFIGASGEVAYYPKPYFTEAKGGLALNQVPVPKAPVKMETLKPGDLGRAEAGWFDAAQGAYRAIAPAAIRRSLKEIGLVAAARRLASASGDPGRHVDEDRRWRLAESIIKTWVGESPVQVLILAMPSAAFLEGSVDPGPHQRRLHDLASALGCRLHDPLPDLLAHRGPERAGFFYKHDGHLSRAGHRAIATSLAPVLDALVPASVEPASP